MYDPEALKSLRFIMRLVLDKDVVLLDHPRGVLNTINGLCEEIERLQMALIAVDVVCHDYEQGDYVIRAVPVAELRDILTAAGLKEQMHG